MNTKREIEIVNAKPPIWDEAHKAFEIDDKKTYYTYGNKIYNPAGIRIADHVVQHEMVHMEQQEALGEEGPAIWWKRYLTDADFRLKQELEAYGKQYWFFCQHQKDRNWQAKFLWEIASALVSPMYKLGDITTHAEVCEAIRFEAKLNHENLR